MTCPCAQRLMPCSLHQTFNQLNPTVQFFPYVHIQLDLIVFLQFQSPLHNQLVHTVHPYTDQRYLSNIEKY